MYKFTNKIPEVLTQEIKSEKGTFYAKRVEENLRIVRNVAKFPLKIGKILNSEGFTMGQ